MASQRSVMTTKGHDAVPPSNVKAVGRAINVEHSSSTSLRVAVSAAADAPSNSEESLDTTDTKTHISINIIFKRVTHLSPCHTLPTLSVCLSLLPSSSLSMARCLDSHLLPTPHSPGKEHRQGLAALHRLASYAAALA